MLLWCIALACAATSMLTMENLVILILERTDLNTSNFNWWAEGLCRSLVYSSGSSKALSGAAGTGCSPPKARAEILGFYVRIGPIQPRADQHWWQLHVDLHWFPHLAVSFHALSCLISMYTSLPMMYTDTRSLSHSSILSPKILHSFTKNGIKSSIIEENSAQKTEILNLGL